MKRLLAILLLTLVVGCGKEDGNSVPDWVLEKERVISFLVDMHIEEAKLIKLGVTRDSTKVLYDFYEKKLFEKHGFIDSVYYKSYNYYLADIDQMTSIYIAVVDSLNVREQIAKQGEGPVPEK